MTGDMLTARKVAQKLDVSTETVLRWVRAGELPAHRMPSGQIRIWPHELESWIDSRATVPTTVPATLMAPFPATDGDTS